MTADEYLLGLLRREAVDTGPQSPVRRVQATLEPILREWAGQYLLAVHPSGSFMKGTANRSGTDIDLFVSLSEQTSETLKEIYEKLFTKMQAASYTPRRQNVSINVTVSGYSVDLVPGKRQGASGSDHSLYRRRADTWTKTNVLTHINHVVSARRQAESRMLKLWRNQKNLDFPSFYVELTVIAALSQGAPGTLSGNVWCALEYLRDRFQNARVVDPANTNNIISDDISAAGKAQIRTAAVAALNASNWNEILI